MLVDLVILESIEVEQDPLQMHNQYVGCFSDKSPFRDIDFLTASVTTEI
jgi:hypothetical protein